MASDVFLAIEALGFVSELRSSRWLYAILNATHILAVALLVGGAVPLSLRLLGMWQDISHEKLARVLSASASLGLSGALLSGATLFSIRASEYAANPAFQIKLALITIGTASAVLAHLRYGWTLDRAPKGALSRVAVISIVCWLGGLFSGRLIAFTGNL